LIASALIKSQHILPAIELQQAQSGGVQMKMSLQGSPVKAPLDVAVFKTTKVVRGRQTDYVGWIMNASLAELTPEERVLRYFVRCTNLYGKLTSGRNQQALKFVIESPKLKLDYMQILAVMKEKTLPYFVRARYTTLMAKLFVDRDPQTHTPQINYTRVWNNVVPEESELNMNPGTQSATIPVCTTGFVELKDYLLQALPQLADCADASGNPSLNNEPRLGQLELIKAQISLVDDMISFGFFVDKDKPEDYTNIGIILTALFSILDTQTRENQPKIRAASQLDDMGLESTLKNDLRSDALNIVLRIFNLRLDTVRPFSFSSIPRPAPPFVPHHHTRTFADGHKGKYVHMLIAGNPPAGGDFLRSMYTYVCICMRAVWLIALSQHRGFPGASTRGRPCSKRFALGLSISPPNVCAHLRLN